MEGEEAPVVMDTEDPDVPSQAVDVVRTSILPGILSSVPLAVRQPFKPLVSSGRRRRGLPLKTVGPKRLKPANMLVSKFLTGCTDFKIGKPLLTALPSQDVVSSSSDEDSDSESSDEEPEFKPHEPLVLYEPTPEEIEAGGQVISVPPLLCQFLRPHQREGVRFVFECVYGLKPFEGYGSILADDMGLGKTLQSLTVLYSMIKNIDAKRCVISNTTDSLNPKDKHIARRCVVVCPCSLVKNWQDEFDKWINNRAKDPKDRIECMALAEANRKTVEAMLDQFLSPHSRYDVLVISYETFRAQAPRFVKRDQALARMSKHPNPHGCIDLLICDEAHRLKNADALTSTALASIKCKRRVLLSGTPMQNNLTEFFAMVNFTNPGLLGTKEAFSKRYERPVLRGREPDATESDTRKAAERQKELSDISNHFIIRRMNRLNAQHLPPKLTQVVCCRLTPCQTNMYQYLLKQRETEAALEGSVKDSLGYVQLLQKVCNHPTIVSNQQRSNTHQSTRDSALSAMLPAPKHIESEPEAPRGRGGRVLARHLSSAPRPHVDPTLSGKMFVLHALMKQLFLARKERIVVISVFMTTLDLIESLCEQEGWPSCKLGGSTPAKKRKQFNDEFNDPHSGYFAFLLSSKAGGCGLNLIGGSRLVMFDLDWNPATDKQAAARCWRDGQKLQCFTYRFVSTGTLEERMLQRQLAKEGLQNVIQDEEQVNHFATDDLKRLFCYRKDTASDLHDELQCAECKGKHAAKKMSGARAEGDNRLSDAAATLCAEHLRSDLSTSPCAAPFLVDYDLSSIDKENNPNSIKHAKKPTDLRSVLTKLDNRQYPKISDVLKDLRLVARTARKIFIDKNHPVHRHANDFEELVNDLWPDLAVKLFEANAVQDSTYNNAIHGDDDDAIPADAPPYKKQLYPLPKEEDLNNWSHHSSVATIADPVFRKALRPNLDAVSFVFGMYQDWDLIQASEALEKKQAQSKQSTPDKEEAPVPSAEPASIVCSSSCKHHGVSSAVTDDAKPSTKPAPMDTSAHEEANNDDSSSTSSSSSSSDDGSSSSSSSDSDDDDM